MLCELRWKNLDLDGDTIRIALNYAVRGGQKLHKDTKTHQKRTLALDEVTCQILRVEKERASGRLAAIGVELSDDAFVFSRDPAGSKPWNHPVDHETHLPGRVGRRKFQRSLILSGRVLQGSGSTCAVGQGELVALKLAENHRLGDDARLAVSILHEDVGRLVRSSARSGK